LSKKQKLVTGKDLAKFNKRQRFYSKFLRISNNLNEKNKLDTIIPLTMNKKFVFPEYDDLSLLFIDHIEKKQEDEESENSKVIEFTKEGALALPFIDEAYFLVEMVKSKTIELVYQETYENDDGSQRKGSAGSIDAYNYQSAYNWGVRILDYEKLSKSLEKEAEKPTTYKIEVKMKKIIRKKKYHKPWKPFRTRRR